MSAISPEQRAPALSIRVDLGHTLARRYADPAFAQASYAALTATIGELLATLGVPATPALTLADASQRLADDQLLELLIDDSLCPCPAELLDRIYSSTLGQVLGPPDARASLAEWLAAAPVGRVAVWFAETVRHALARLPGSLLGTAQIAAYSAGLPATASAQAEWSLLPARLEPVLRALLAMRISIADTATVGRVLAEAGDAEPALIAEQCVAALRPQAVEVHVEPGYLRQITTADNGRLFSELLPFMRDGLFVELGLLYPTFRFIADPTLPSQAFAFTLNHLTGPPQVGLGPEQILVNDSSDRLRLAGIEGQATANPATNLPATVTDAGHKQALEAMGLTVWDMLGYFILALAAELRSHGQCFVDQALANRQVAQLSKAFPELKRAAEQCLAQPVLAATLRALVADQISIRNLRRILERLVEFELFVGAGDRNAFVRAGLSDYIGHKFARGTQTLVVYLLDAEFEAALAAPPAGPAADDLHRRLVRALRDEMRHLPPTAQRPVLLTTVAAFPGLRAILAAELPRLTCVSYGDLAPGLNIQPVARISSS